MNSKKRFVAQLLILLYVVVGAIAFCDHLDKKNWEETIEYNKIQNRIKQADTILTYSNESRPEKNETVLSFSMNNYDCNWFPYSEPIIEYVSYPIEQTAQIEMVNESLEIPLGNSDFHMYMDYRTLTNTTTKQWKLQQMAWTDSDGFRRIGNDYCVALGTYYGNIGDRFRIITDEGNSYTAIMSDAKGSDAVFYDSVRSWYHYAGNGCNVVEFIVQTEYLPSAVTISGSCGAVDYLSGNVVSIEMI